MVDSTHQDKPCRSGFDTQSTSNSIAQQYQTQNETLLQMLTDLEIAARHNVTILLIGETGSGKTYLSRLIHEASGRGAHPFLHVACGALPGELIESELFGHVRGAFTSAHADKAGKFIAAGKGTLLLDEIDCLGLKQQVKLLRVIENGEYEAVGSNQTVKSLARLVVASNVDLQPLVDKNDFRPDLYYRLNMMKFVMPPLRERKEDIFPLSKRIMTRYANCHNTQIHHIEQNFFDTLLDYNWPGNVRELENVIQRAVIFCRDGRITASQLPEHIRNPGQPATSVSPNFIRKNTTLPLMQPERRRELDQQIAQTEREIILQALRNNDSSRVNTARELGISRVTLYNKMKKHGIG